MKLLFKIGALLCVFTGAAISLRAQTEVPPQQAAYQMLSDAQLDQLLGPIALYPDPLIAEILPAATLPTQIVLASRYVSGGGDPNQIDQQPWDASVQALARYPDLLKWLDDNLNWTTELGQAFLYQQPAVMDSVQRLRAAAYKLGNLQSQPQQQVVNDGGEIEIVPTDPQVVYVPLYQPNQVYYQYAGGVPFISFGIGWPMGAWLGGDFDWGHRHLVFWDRDHPRPSNWWHESPRQRDFGHAPVWRAEAHHDVFVGNRGDRGYALNPGLRAPSRPIARPEPARPVQQHEERGNVFSRPAPAPIQQHESVSRPQPVSRPPSTGAFMGIQSSHETKSFSTRGQQSIQTITPPAPPAARPAAPASGGGNSSNSQKKR